MIQRPEVPCTQPNTYTLLSRFFQLAYATTDCRVCCMTAFVHSTWRSSFHVVSLAKTSWPTWRCVKSVVPVFFGCRMLALKKTGGGIRPIPVGLMLCRLESKCASSPVDFLIWRFSQDLISAPAPLNAHTVLQLCSDYGLLLLLWRRPGPLATSDICF